MGLKYDRRAVIGALERGRQPSMVEEREEGSAKDWKPLKKEECPNCQSKTRGCKVGPKGIRGYCFNQMDETGDGYYPIGGPRFIPAIDGHRPHSVRTIKHTEAVVEDDVLATAFCILMLMCPLTDEHANELLKRTLDIECGFDAQHVRDNYGSLPPLESSKNLRLEIKRQIQKATGRTDIKWVNALIKSNQRGIICPFMDVHGNIVAAQIRNDDPKCKPKDRWRSITGSKLRAHIPTTTKLWITEGKIKSEIASKVTGNTFAAIPGIGNCHEEIVATAVSQRASVVIAFDSEDKKETREAERRLATRLHSAGISVEIASWDMNLGKGIDDMLVAGHRDKIVITSWALSPAAQAIERLTSHGTGDGPRPKLRAKPAGPKKTSDRATLKAVSDALEVWDPVKALRFERAACCGKTMDAKSCSVCGKAACICAMTCESSLCTYCSTRYLKMLPVALTADWPAELVYGEIDVKDKNPKGVQKARKLVQKKLKKHNVALASRVLYLLAPGKLAVLSADLSDSSDIQAIGINARATKRENYINSIVTLQWARAKHLQNLVAANDVAALTTDEWVERFVSVSGGKPAKKTLPWPTMKKVRKLYAQSKKKDDDAGSGRLSECCGAVWRHTLIDTDTGTILGIRNKKPWSFREGFKAKKAFDADPKAWVPPRPRPSVADQDRAKAAAPA